MYKKERKKYYSELNLSDILDNKKFWKTVQPLFTDKRTLGKKISLVNKEKIISNDSEVAQELNSFFENATKSLGINENSYIVEEITNSNDPIDKAIQKYKFHPSILLIKSKVDKLTPFSFCETTSLEIEKEIRDLNSNKATTHGNIPTKILKQSSEACKESLTNLFNKTIRESNFPKELKLADVTPI